MKFSNRPNPLSKAGFLSSLLFSWIKPFLNFTLEVVFKQEHHYKLPQYDKVNTHIEKVSRGLRNKRTIIGMIFSEYKAKLIEFSIIAILSASLSLLSGQLLKNTFMILKEGKLDDHTVIRKLAIYFSINMILSSISKFLSTLYIFRSNRLSQAIRSSIFNLMLEKVLKLSVVSIPLSKIDPNYKAEQGT